MGLAPASPLVERMESWMVDFAFTRLQSAEKLGYPLARWSIRSGRQGSTAVVVAVALNLDPEFLVLRGSEAFVEISPAFRRDRDRSARELRNSLIDDGTLVLAGDVYVFQADYVFHSASLAASVILGRAASGPVEWRTTDGTRLSDLH